MSDQTITPPAQSEIPNKLGKYEILEVIGHGGMGMVYKGFDPFCNRDVAVKVCIIEQDDQHAGRLQRRMFFNEAHLAGLLSHVNILSVYDAGEEGNLPYLVMEYVEHAKTLKDFCGVDQLMDIKTVVEIAFKCAKALDYAHRRGVIHRDIKPSNIMLTEKGEVKIVDFGIARRLHSDTTQVMGMIGSPLYMSPEQVQEEELSNRTDLYSLGVVMYEMLTGKPPFTSDRFSGLMHQIINDPPQPMQDLRSDLPDVLDDIMQKTLEKDPTKRYATGAELAVDLSHAFDFLEHLEIHIDDQEKFEGIKNLSFFADFTDPEIWEVIHAAVWEKFATGDRIIAEGNIDQSFYIIVEGDVIVKKANRILGSLEAGDCFGEMGYITKAKRTATILAVKDVTTLRINETLIERASINCQLKFLRIFLRTMILRLTQTNEILAQ